MVENSAISQIDTVIFDVGNVLYRWNLRCLFEKLIDDRQELDWFLAHVVTPEWHFQTDQGRDVADIVSERIAEYPKYESHIRAYVARFNETIPGAVPGSLEIVNRLAAKGVPLFGITNFGAEFWKGFRPTARVFDLFENIVVSGVEKLAKPDPAIYRLAMERFARLPEQCLFIDDRADNIAAAEAMGIHGHLFLDAVRLEARLEQLNLL